MTTTPHFYKATLTKSISCLETSELRVNLGWAVVFAGYSGFLHQLQLACHDLIWPKIDEKRISKILNPNSNMCFWLLADQHMPPVAAVIMLNM